MHSMNTAAERLDALSMRITECGCQIWLGALFKNGYGAIRVDGTVHYTHRLSWAINNGPIPDRMFVCHRCDTRSCVNPDHLFLGTDLDNIADMVAKGRNKPPKVRRKFSPDIAMEIAVSTGSNRDIAKKFGTTHATVARIKRDVRGYVFVNPHGAYAEK